MSAGDLTQWREALRWLASAATDLRVARLTATDPSILGATAFHVQQATEKILKALLVAAAADFRRIHDLDELAAAAHRYWPHVIATAFPLARATTWYVVSRYPGIDEVSLDAGEIAAALGEAEALIATVTQLVPAALRVEDGTIPDQRDS